jgi:hypothetical protein
MADFTLAGGPVRPSITKVKQGDDLRKLGLGTSVFFWFGDDGALGTLVGQVPPGFLSRPLYKEWIRGVHGAGFFSYGPYQRLEGVGSFRVWFFLEISNRGNAGDEVLTADVSDYDNGGAAIAGPTTFKVQDFPAGTDGFTIYSPELSIPAGNHRIEARIVAKGGASLKLWGIRWEVNTL